MLSFVCFQHTIYESVVFLMIALKHYKLFLYFSNFIFNQIISHNIFFKKKLSILYKNDYFQTS